MLWLCLALSAGLAVAQRERPLEQIREEMQRALERERTLRPVVRGKRGAVAAGSTFATEAGMRLFHAGGNAVDAGVATTFAAAVTEFSHFGLGGEAPMVIRWNGRVYAVSGVGTAPKLATAEFYRQRTPDAEDPRVAPDARPGQIPSTGILSAVLPGLVDGLILALGEFGTKSFAEVIHPALELADGFPIDEMRVMAIERFRPAIETWPEAKRIFLPDGQVPRPGQIFRQPDLARTLRGMVEAERRASAGGRDRKTGLAAARNYFYKGPVAKEIDRYMKANKGLIRYEDLAAFRARVEEPASTTYRGYEIYKPGFWTQGPAMLETLNLLEGFDLKKMGAGSADYLHTLAEAMKLAYADRDGFYGDPLLAQVPGQTLLSKSYAAARAKLINAAAASNEPRPGSPDGLRAMHPAFFEKLATLPAGPVRDTTCVGAVDASGVMFSATPSGAWLPSVIAGDTGVPLSQRLQSFLLIPGHPNELKPGKRPRVTLSPTLVLKDGKPYLALSTPGGDNQDQALVQVMLYVLEFGMNPQQAVEAPRLESRHLVSSFDNHSFRPGILYLDERHDPAAAKTLAARGHRVGVRSRWRSGAAPVLIRVDPASGAIEAGADPYGYRYAAAW